MSYLPCFLCAAKLDKRTDKNLKPYFVCNPCGIQLFVRRPHGIKLLDKLLRDSAKHEIPFKQRAEEAYEIACRGAGGVEAACDVATACVVANRDVITWFPPRL